MKDFSIYYLKVSASILLLMLGAIVASLIDYFSVAEGDFYHLAGFLLVPLFFLSATHLRWDLRNLFNPIVPFALYSFFFYWLSFILLFEFSTYRSTYETYVSSILCYLAVFFSYHLLSFMFDGSHSNSLIKLKTKMQNSAVCADTELKLVWRIGVTLSFLFTTLFFIKAGGIPMFADNPEVARVEAMKGSGTIQRLSYLPMYISVIALSIDSWLHNKKFTIVQIMVVIIFVFYNMLTGPRSYALWVFLYLWISYQLLHFNRIKIINGMMLATVALFIVLIAGGVRYSGLDSVNAEDAIIRFINRVYMNPVNANRIIEEFASNAIDKNSFLIELAVLLPGHQPDLGTYLKNFIGIKYDGGGITVPLPAEGYMNYGYLGSVLYGVVFSIILKMFMYAVTLVRNPFYRYIFMLLLSLQFMGVVTMGLSGIIVKTTIPTIFTFLLIFSMSKIITKMTNARYNYIGKNIN